MTKKVTVNKPGSPKGEPFVIPGLGLVSNGETVELTDEQVAAFEGQGYEFPSNGHLKLPLETVPVQEDATTEAVVVETPAKESKKGGDDK